MFFDADRIGKREGDLLGWRRPDTMRVWADSHAWAISFRPCCRLPLPFACSSFLQRSRPVGIPLRAAAARRMASGDFAPPARTAGTRILSPAIRAQDCIDRFRRFGGASVRIDPCRAGAERRSDAAQRFARRGAARSGRSPAVESRTGCHFVGGVCRPGCGSQESGSAEGNAGEMGSGVGGARGANSHPCPHAVRRAGRVRCLRAASSLWLADDLPGGARFCVAGSVVENPPHSGGFQYQMRNDVVVAALNPLCEQTTSM